VEDVRRSLLDSGLRVVTESLPELRSVTIGAWVGTGSRDETDAQSGASHFLEHLLFKGTPEKSAREIAEAVESVGGEMNAFTGQEETVFYVRVPDAHLALAVEILTDVLWRPAFRPDEVDSERQVILEEIGMRDDTPDDLVHDLFAGALFPQHALGRSVLGTDSSIEAMPRDDIASYHAAHYRPTNIVLAAAGNLTHDGLIDLLSSRLDGLEGDRPERDSDSFGEPRSVAVIERPTEQAHVVVGLRSVSHLDPDRYALTVLNQALGGGMSSRLFQEVREERGLAYSVYSYRGAFADTGMLAIYAGTSPERVHETLAVIDGELDRLSSERSLPARELDAAKGHLKGAIAMSLETSSSRMRRLGRAELIEHEIPTLDEIVRRIDAVTGDDIERVIDRVIADRPRTLATVGPFSESDFET
jgi:predicted Zn-dependent peptidase